jgi:hypothetical protein
MRFRPEGIMGYKEFSFKKTIQFFKEFPQNRVKIIEKLTQSLEERTKKKNRRSDNRE